MKYKGLKWKHNEHFLNNAVIYNAVYLCHSISSYSLYMPSKTFFLSHILSQVGSS